LSQIIDTFRIAEQGTHTQLLQQRGQYYRLYTQQFRHDLEVEYGVAEKMEENKEETVPTE